MTADDLRAVLRAYREVKDASWPTLNPGMAARADRWAQASEADLREELAGYLREAAPPASQVRVFWKLGPEFVFGGCNDLFAQDAGLSSADEMVGLTDFDDRLPWKRQAAKYRLDDKAVVEDGTPRLGMIERQQSGDGQINWVKVSKAPVRSGAAIVGVLGMYEPLDPETGRRLFAESLRQKT
jgi:hypothetical protein